MSDLVNFIHLNGDKLTGNIASIAFDIDITGERFDSTNPDAPMYRLYAKTPRGRRIEIGGIWQKDKKSGDGTYLSLSADTGFGKLNANLGRYPQQDDESLMAVIPWR